MMKTSIRFFFFFLFSLIFLSPSSSTNTSGKHQTSGGIAQAHRSRPWLRYLSAQGEEEKREKDEKSRNYRCAL